MVEYYCVIIASLEHLAFIAFAKEAEQMTHLTLAKKAGKNLKNLIKNSKFKTQEEFAEVMFVDPSTVRRWIAHGIRDLNLIEQIAIVFGIDFMELLK